MENYEINDVIGLYISGSDKFDKEKIANGYY
jgi:hypothetical protein